MTISTNPINPKTQFYWFTQWKKIWWILNTSNSNMNYYLSWLCGQGKQTWQGVCHDYWHHVRFLKCDTYIDTHVCTNFQKPHEKLTFFIIIKENSAIKKKKVYLPTMNLKYSVAFMEFSTLMKSWRILSAQATVSQIWRMTTATSSPGDPSLSCQSNASLFPISFKHPPSPFPASLARGLSFQRNV